jgi:hypothetical protein
METESLEPLAPQPSVDLRQAIFLLHAPLLERVAVAERYGSVLERLPIDGDAKRRADFVLPAVGKCGFSAA